jgi:hypothetical protein
LERNLTEIRATYMNNIEEKHEKIKQNYKEVHIFLRQKKMKTTSSVV